MRGRKPDLDTDTLRQIVYGLRMAGFSRRLVYKTMRNVFGIHKDESTFNKMYNQAKTKAAKDPAWATRALKLLPTSEDLWSPKIFALLAANAIWHGKDPRRPKLPPLAIYALAILGIAAIAGLPDAITALRKFDIPLPPLLVKKLN